MANTNTRMAETTEHWKRWISKEPLRLLSTIISNVGDGALTVPIPKVPVPTRRIAP